MENTETKENTLYVKLVKNILGKIVAILFLCFFWWVYIICAILIVLKEGFPIIYKQKRVGKGGKLFDVYKFRTMIKDADKVGPSSTAKEDSRITPLGAFLRNTSLDEIPQLFNVIKGDMCLVGFRPDVWREKTDIAEKKYLLKPGITGLAQVNGRSSLTWEEKSRLEEQYPFIVSLKCDIEILVKTIYQVVLRKGTN